MDASVSPSGDALLPRYRRLLTFGDVLDESIQLFRHHWVTFALISAVSLIPPGLILIWFSAAGLTSRSISLADLQTGQTALLPAQAGAIMVSGLVSALFDLAWTAALVTTTDACMRGHQPGVRRVYSRAMKRFPVLMVASVVYVLAVIVCSAIAVLLFILTVFGIGGSIVATIALVVWWLRPGARKSWVKWLIILASPFGLAVYFSLRWSMVIVAAVLERRGPIDSLRRSSQLVDTHWFRVASILTVGSLIVGVLLSAPAALIDIPLTFQQAARGQFGLSPAQAAISNAVTVVLQVLFASLGTIIYTLTFIDLRNRREGTDIGERLTQLETAPITANG